MYFPEGKALFPEFLNFKTICQQKFDSVLAHIDFISRVIKSLQKVKYVVGHDHI